MAKYDHGGGCPCGLKKVCDCKHTPYEWRQDQVEKQWLDVSAELFDAKVEIERLRAKIESATKYLDSGYRVGRYTSFDTDHVIAARQVLKGALRSWGFWAS